MGSKLEQLPIETTVYSMSASPPTESNRRANKRHLTLFRVGSILLGERRELCLVKNISAGGALIRVYSALKAKQALEVELKEGQPIPGRVSWVRGTDAGIEFDEPVDVLDLLRSSEDGPRPRMPRVQVGCVCWVRDGADVSRAQVQNVSQGGLSVESSIPLRTGADVTVSLPGLPPQSGVVRWSDEPRHGIAFNNVLPLAALVEWLQSRKGA